MNAEPALTQDTMDAAKLIGLTADAVDAASTFLDKARDAVSDKVKVDGRVSASLVDQHQYAAHAYAWMATYVESLRQLHDWAERLMADGEFGETEQLILQIGFGEYLWQLYGGIPMSQGEIIRPQDAGLMQEDQRVLMTEAVMWLTQHGNSDTARVRLAQLMAEQEGASMFGTSGLDDEYEMVREQFRRFADDKVIPDAHGWHLRDEL
ncbi:MAG: acyl-CoA dehydrogenase, partial [Pseudomonadota bacterium]